MEEDDNPFPELRANMPPGTSTTQSLLRGCCNQIFPQTRLSKFEMRMTARVQLS